MFRYLKKTNCVQHNQEAGKSYAVYGVVSNYDSVTWTVDVQRDYHGKIILVSLYARVDKPGAGAELRHMYGALNLKQADQWLHWFHCLRSTALEGQIKTVLKAAARNLTHPGNIDYWASQAAVYAAVNDERRAVYEILGDKGLARLEHV